MIDIILIVAIVFSAIIFHEYAHGWVANQRGDPTAKQAGRLTLNPWKHVDPVGTLLVPGVLLLMRYVFHIDTFLVGWAKPVPVNFLRLRNPRIDMMLVAIAGPLTNILLALGFSAFLKPEYTQHSLEYIHLGIFVNLLLAVFNMMPVPPLDGSRILMGLLPQRLAAQYARLERYGLGIVLILLYLGMFEYAVLPIVEMIGQWMGANFS